MRAELAGRVDQISALHSERHQMQLEVSLKLSLCLSGLSRKRSLHFLCHVAA